MVKIHSLVQRWESPLFQSLKNEESSRHPSISLRIMVMADETAVDRGTRGQGVDLFFLELKAKHVGPPAGVGPAQRHDAGLHLGAHLMRAGGWAAGVIDEAGETQGGVALQPVVHGLAGYPIAAGHFHHREPA